MSGHAAVACCPRCFDKFPIAQRQTFTSGAESVQSQGQWSFGMKENRSGAIVGVKSSMRRKFSMAWLRIRNTSMYEPSRNAINSPAGGSHRELKQAQRLWYVACFCRISVLGVRQPAPPIISRLWLSCRTRGGKHGILWRLFGIGTLAFRGQ